MNEKRIRKIGLAACLAVGAPAMGCELLVQLDRGAVVGSADSGCPICSSPSEDGGDASTEAMATEEAGAD